VESVEADVERRYEELRDMIHTEREERRDQQNLRVGQERGMSQTTAIIVAAVGFVVMVLGAALAVASFVTGAPPPVMPVVVP
jgi:hypothetical protein